jgi:hypothetical protein
MCFLNLQDYSNETNLKIRLEEVEQFLVTSTQPASVSTAATAIDESKSLKTWHSSEHAPGRQEIADLIMELLKTKTSSQAANSEEWLRSLPDKARRLEMNLYSLANSFDEYLNKATLKSRLQQLAKSMGNTRPEVKEEAPKDNVAETKDDASKIEARPEANLLPNGLPRFKDDTEDVDDVQENEHFDTRQSFLNLCQGNHYQFDQLRRAKHTSMMVLYHLHNPDAPKFVPSCNNCHKDILIGARHHCESCDIDFCDECHSVQAQQGKVTTQC